MNPGKLNHRLKFSQQTGMSNTSGGTTVSLSPLVLSDTAPTDVTWGSLEPIKQWNQLVMNAAASVLDQDRICIIRYRVLFGSSPAIFFKDTEFEDLNNPGIFYMVHSVLPYQPGSKSTFQNTDQQVYKDNVWVFMLVKVRS